MRETPAVAAADTAEDSFGRRLRAERERRKIALETIAASTKIGIGLLKGLERDDLSRWPSGLFRRSFMRSYAEAIGLDADEAVREFLERFPDPLAASDAVAASDAKGKSVPAAPLRLTLAEAPSRFAAGPILARFRARFAAAVFDVLATTAVAVGAFVLVDSFWSPLAITMLCYYVGSILILGNTPGVNLFGRGSTSYPGPAEILPMRGSPAPDEDAIGELGPRAASEA
jgi:transcriptional regulator with XRE-family HTH domain